ncbi:MAG: hypothetical protein ONA69_04935 [candidate division KSB1 bacterium]|nr:hypothetical protein [candidate division KSB1 bacterium]MDZ7346122.1 hypothetical protein [candidate division KSB1 bacterium]
MIRALLCILLFYGLGTAQQPDSTTVDSTAVQSKDQGVKLFLDKIEVEGSLEKPQAVFILPGRSPQIEDFAITRSFISELFRPVERSVAVEVSKRGPSKP